VMRIAQIAPLTEPVPPTYYGGTERVVSGLTEELVRRGHEVVLFASADSRTAAELVPCAPRSLRLDTTVIDPLAYTVAQLEAVRRRARDFDVIHNHIDYIAFPVTRGLRTPMITTLHGRLDLPDLVPIYAMFSDVPLVSISDAQRRPFPGADWIATIYNGIDPERYAFQERPGPYLVFLGRVSPEKGVVEAIQIAQALDMPLRMAAKVDPVDRTYFEEQVRPLLRDPRVEYLGEIDDAGKSDLLGGALAYLFPIDWPEPFGITMVEAMACGTPVIALNRGSVPEVVAHGRTGFVCASVDDMIQAVAQVDRLSRRACRREVEERFSIGRMVDRYEEAYGLLLRERASRGTARRRSYGPAGNGAGSVATISQPAAAASSHDAGAGVDAARGSGMDPL
jgi:glycosyltransferase involved in cell wall biosynthesis